MRYTYKIIRLRWRTEYEMSRELNANLNGGWRVISQSQDGDELVVIAELQS